MRILDRIPVVDLFAGPGGLAEGFSKFSDQKGRRPFKIVLSIEKDAAAHQTLELRSFYRQFDADIPDEYYRHLRNELSREELFNLFPSQAEKAGKESWKAELGKVNSTEVDQRIESAVQSAPLWVLCGGPPCQAYSIIGRARSGGIDPKDHRLYLYREYLRILAAHRPPVFILENVKGLLSSRVGGQAIFKQMLGDLRRPDTAISMQRLKRTGYVLYSLTVSPRALTLDGHPEFDYRDFIIKSEEFGLPQSRHRLILLGVREDFSPADVATLLKCERPVPASKVLTGLPRLRSGLSRRPDGREEWRSALAEMLVDDSLNDIPNEKCEQILAEIRYTLETLSAPRADRGCEFIKHLIKSNFRPDWYCDGRIGGVCNHVTRPHMTTDLHRYLFAACFAKVIGRSPEIRDFPSALLPKHKNILDADKQTYFDDRFRVQLPGVPSATITSHIAKDGHYFIHYDQSQCRSLTVREAARLQTFPDNYLFCGFRTQQYIQVGNAVPPLLAYQVAAVVADTVEKIAVDIRKLRGTASTNQNASLLAAEAIS